MTATTRFHCGLDDDETTAADGDDSVQESAAAMTVSVVVASHGRRESLSRCLEALCVQSLPRHRFEVIVCDDGSPEPLEPALDHFAERIALTVVRQRQAGPASARNEGARLATGRYLAFTDDDCVPTRDWLARLVARFEQYPEHLVGGAIVNLLPNDPYATATQLIMDCLYARYSIGPSTQLRFFSTANLAAPTERFRMLGGFSSSFPLAAGEDYDFCARWHHAGYLGGYAPEVVVSHAHGHDLASFWKQHFAYGRGLLRVRQRMARRAGRPGVQLEHPGFYGELLAYPIKKGDGPLARRCLHAALVLLAQVATAVGAVRELVFGREMPEDPSDAALSPAGLSHVGPSPSGAEVTTAR
jgi:GT2 family glycosyltransferase